ncbi:molecular chaperone DnaK [Algoriphagus sp. C2-6-M1]|uniref:molecular chaperone DnaK n=1 Tax=Algoriphagus persicinus TaxID=3108754 RepID=UPI002B3C675D|nr:molecular chaperone DnaK [Algoriphagus sp. C2-6-M1]MEB2779401.1 molecular chaperone DnaK [Algoriphagus sp. C2-6-M1]
MKISKSDFESMKAKYDKEIKKGKPAKDKKNKDKIDQTNWIFFNRETLEGLLAKADKDPKKGGVQFYITEYTKEVAEKYHPNYTEQLTGALTLVMRPANVVNELVSGVVGGEGGDYENNGRICPPFCEPEPTGS